MDLQLKGLKALIAGASKGIGLATAEVLAAEGCDVAIGARGQDGVDRAADALRSHGSAVFGATVDLTDAAALHAWVDQAAAALGGCDIFIPMASAGLQPASEETWKTGFDLDLMAVWRGVTAALPYLRRSKSAAVVCISTTAALEEFFGPQPYNALKAAVIAHASGLAQQLAPENIRVNTVTPGPIFIDGGGWDYVQKNIPAMYQDTVEKMPMKRFGSADEIARTIAFLASPASSYTTGANVVVDGGFTRRVQF